MSNPRDFGAAGDGQTDDTEAIQHAIEQGDGPLYFPPGDYRITRTIVVELARTGRFGMDGALGTAKLLMAGPGPAFHLVGTHDKSADPAGFAPAAWAGQRMPLVQNVEIEGRHPEACGFLVEGTMQSTFAGVLLRQLRDGIRLHRRARNVLVTHCHIYDNRGVGIFLDHVNLHQAIITGSHVSYCRGGGIKIVGSEIRNLQITGNDIEYNYDPQAAASADVWIDCSEEGSTVREGTIVSNTVQAKYSPGGANVRIIGQHPRVNHRAGLWTISNNLIGSQEINVHLAACRGVTVSGNVIYSGHVRNLQLDGSRNIVLAANCFDHNPDYGEQELCTGVRLADSHDVVLSGSLVHDCQAGRHTVAGAPELVREGLLEIVRCRRVAVSGCEVLDGAPHGIYVEESDDVSITGCTVLDSRLEKKSTAAICFRGTGRGNLVAGNRLGAGAESAVEADAAAGVRVGENWTDGS
ncbi:MAG: right-handed parallel beta-helix repeat-containing protein [Pirellulales bacterium]